jgi:hypothetical protein
MAPLVMPSCASNRATAAVHADYTGCDRSGVAEILRHAHALLGYFHAHRLPVPCTSARAWLTLNEERILRTKHVDVNLFYIELLKNSEK